MSELEGKAASRAQTFAAQREWVANREIRWVRIQTVVLGVLIVPLLGAIFWLTQFAAINEDRLEVSLLVLLCVVLVFGMLSGIVALNRIIRRSQRTETALRESEERWRSLVQSAPDIIINIDRDGKILFINRATWGFTVHGVLGTAVYDYIPAQQAEWVRNMIASVFEHGVSQRYDLDWKAPDGSVVWFACRLDPIWQGEKVLSGLLLVRDITIRKRQEQELRKQQEFLRKVIDTDPNLVFAKDWDGRFTLVNKAVAEIYGSTVEGLIGKTDADFNPNKEEVEHFLRDDREVMNQLKEKFIPEEQVTDPKSKETRWFQTIKRPLITEDGEVAQVLGIATDITPRKKVEENLRRSEERFRTLANNMPGVVYLCKNDARRSMIYLNNAVEELTGVSAKEFLSNRFSFMELYHPEDVCFIEPAITLAVHAHRQFKLVYRIRHKNGDWRWIEERGQGVFEESGELRFLEGTLIDVTDLKQAEDERRKFEISIQQSQKLESLGVLAGGIAHDFNNLLMGMLGNAGLALMEMTPSSPGRQSVQQIETAALRAAELTRQLLAYSGKGKFVMEVFNVSRLIEETSHLLKAVISKKAAIEYHFDPELPCIEADPTQIRQVFMNLITNASDALEGSDGIIRIRTGLMHVDRELLNETQGSEDLREGDYIYVEVSDNGIGMSPETLTKIFDPFFTTKFTGRGLGLSAVIGIVRGHHGCIKVDSVPGKGTTFLVLLPPTKKEETVPVRAPENSVDWRGAGSVLVVDDEDAVSKVAKAILEQFGFAVSIANNGQEAIQLFKENPEQYVAVLLDLTMPRMSGEETFGELRQVREDIPILLSSGYSEQEFNERFENRQLAGFIQKPYQPISLIEKIRTVLQHQTIQPAPASAPKPEHKHSKQGERSKS